MITEDYCSYEVAKLLKEKGFDAPCIRHWDCDDHSLYGYNDIPISNSELQANEYNGFSAPSQSMAMKWLREKHNICITIYPDKENGYEAVLYDIENNVEIVLQSFGVYGIHIYKEIYEDAVETALKYYLENLIEI